MLNNMQSDDAIELPVGQGFEGAVVNGVGPVAGERGGVR